MIKKILIALFLIAVSIPSFAHDHYRHYEHHDHDGRRGNRIGLQIGVPGFSIGYHSGWRGDRIGVEIAPYGYNYPPVQYSYGPPYGYHYEFRPVFCADYYGYRYQCGTREVLVPNSY